MITVVVGHRGTGKTELMKRLQLYIGVDSAEFVDLDLEIEKKIGRTIPELFMEHGENYFREIEQQLFLETLQKPHKEMYLVVGAGFQLTGIPAQVRVLWVRRKTDLEGRIFLDRPRLHPELAPLEEFKKRAFEREGWYRKHADEVYLMPEGVFDNHHHAMQVEKKILLHQLTDVGGILTLMPELMTSDQRWSLFKMRYAQRGISCFEIRDDLFSYEDALKIIRDLPHERFIYSFRKKAEDLDIGSQAPLLEILGMVSWVDWPWELGTPEEILRHAPREKVILSLHDQRFFQDCLEFENKVSHFKYAPEVSAFGELWQGHQWQRAQPASRSFLPRSQDGRWDWYRLLQKGHQWINFWREGDGSAGDQPSLWSWLMMPERASAFAAVLGHPVNHSFTPMEHSEFFKKRNLSVLAVNVARDEWAEALPILRQLGLCYAAVTSPHKENAAALCHHESLAAVNTLYWNSRQNTWLGTSTDSTGFLELIEGVGMIAPLQKDIYIWGGGGTLEMLQKSLPHASYFSSRTGALRTGEMSDLLTNPKIVIWAAPRSAETLFPPTSWRPSMIFDLNYKEDSMGREYAQRCGANYQSGLVMFTAQAQGQRLFWNQCEENG